MVGKASTRAGSVRRTLRRTTLSRWLWIAVMSCAALAVALVTLAHALAPSPETAQTLIGHPAPAFTLAAAQDERILAQPITFDGRNSRPTLLVFFNTLCVHCIPSVQAARDAAQAPGQPAADVIYLDAPGENAEITGQYMSRLQAQPPVLLDARARVASSYRVTYYPTIVLVDAQGVIRAVWVGAPSISALRSAIAHSH
ncbi:MAG TPA: TlpA disulfide reductase family protein [Ktedonobacterales bacterium]|jgi:peroxiredoxin|nr:TlpA disulfide reductase family protein [Ktedonobacterales bacterium]